jgi:hypothetical protein
MKLKNLACIALLSLTLAACKNDKKEEAAPQAEAVAPVDEDIVVITLNATVKKDDSFQIYYKQDMDAEAPFKEEESLYAEFKGSDAPQDIVWKLPKDVLPTMLRFDSGINKEQSPIVIHKFTISRNGNKAEFAGSDFPRIFMANEETVKFDPTTATATPIQLQGGGYDPLFNSTILLNDELAKIAR